MHHDEVLLVITHYSFRRLVYLYYNYFLLFQAYSMASVPVSGRLLLLGPT